MQWKLTEEQNAYRKTLRGWLADVAPPEAVRRWLNTGNASAFVSRFVADGWAGVGLPENIGGQGGGLVELALTAEELGRAAVPSADWLAAVLAGHAELADTTALLIPADVVPDEAPALRVDADGAVSGTAARVLAGDSAARFVVPADGELRVVEANAPGVVRTVRRPLDRSRSLSDVTLHQVPSVRLDLAADDVLCQASARAAVLVAADSLGATERMLHLAVEYSKQRHQFGVPIGSFQAVKHAAATMLVGIEAARSVVYFAAASVDAGDPQAPLHAAAAKAQVTAEGARSADTALTLHGAIGYTWEHDLHLFYKRAKLDEPLFGTPAAWNERIADGLALSTQEGM
ncbi:MAG TPA: acyl-CoA dehydrogenase family protein [Streptomyces sp.]|nr:acyl-CoA dehydrogenase family protein [Streptomyces sp.]